MRRGFPGRLEEGDIADPHHITVQHRSEHQFAHLLGIGEVGVVALDLGHDQILLAGNAAEVILTRFRRVLVENTTDGRDA